MTLIPLSGPAVVLVPDVVLLFGEGTGPVSLIPTLSVPPIIKSDDMMYIRYLDLRSTLTVLLDDRGPMTTKQLAAALDALGLTVDAAGGRPGKIISDALRAEMRWGRVRRVKRGTYAISHIPRTTRKRFHQRAASVIAAANR